MGKFREGQRVCVTAGRHSGKCGVIVFCEGWDYALRLEDSGDLIFEHHLAHLQGSKEAEEAERRAQDEARAKQARAAERRLEEEAQAKALAAIRRAEQEEAAACAAEQREAAGRRKTEEQTTQRKGEWEQEREQAASGQEAVEQHLAVSARPASAAAAPRSGGPGAHHSVPPSALQLQAEEEEQLLLEGSDSNAGPPQTQPVQAGDIRRGTYLVLKGHPCKCIEVSASKTGKHGHAKTHIVALDVFTGKKYEDVFPSSHFLEVPSVKRREYLLLNVDSDTGAVSLLHESGSTKDDLNLPTFAKLSEQTDDAPRLHREIVESFELGKTVRVVVVCACGEEKIVDMKAL